jgi:hypothetical protein
MTNQTFEPNATPATSYEFSAEQEKIFATLSRSMGRIGFWVILIGVLNVVAALAGGDSAGNRAFVLFEGILLVYVGVKFKSGAKSFEQIEKTKGSDIAHLMQGVKALQKMFTGLDSIILFVYAVLLAAVVVGLVAFLAATKGRG